MTTTRPAPVTKKNLKRTTIFLTEEHHEALRRIAFERKTSMAQLVREAILDVLDDDEDDRTSLEPTGDEESISLDELERRRNASGPERAVA